MRKAAAVAESLAADKSAAYYYCSRNRSQSLQQQPCRTPRRTDCKRKAAAAVELAVLDRSQWNNHKPTVVIVVVTAVVVIVVVVTAVVVVIVAAGTRPLLFERLDFDEAFVSAL